MTPTRTGLQILLVGGQTLLFHADDAAQTVQLFQQGHFRLKGVTTLGGTDPMTGVVWSVKLDSVVALHTVLIEPPPQQPISRSPVTMSGMPLRFTP